MLTRILFTIVAIFSLIGAAIANEANEFVEGRDYVKIVGEQTAQQEITEFFSFYCPHCFSLEPFIEELKASQPAEVVFKKNHVDGMPGQSLEIEHLLTKALITAKMLDVSDKIVPAIFQYIHVSNADFDSINDIKNLFLINGIDGAAVDKTMASFSVDRQANQMQKNTEALRQQGYTKVPTLIINGQYMPITKNIKSMEQYKLLISFLINKTH